MPGFKLGYINPTSNLKPNKASNLALYIQLDKALIDYQ